MRRGTISQTAITAVMLAGCGGSVGVGGTAGAGGTTGAGGTAGTSGIAGTGGAGGAGGAAGTGGTSGTAGMGGTAGAGGAAGAGGTAGMTCEYNSSHSLQHLALSVTLPDGSVQSCALQRLDGGVLEPVPFSGEVSGSVTEVDGGGFSVDTCVPGTGCSAAVYRFAFAAPGLTVPMRLGRQVTVKWMVSNILVRACLGALVVNDGLPSDVPSGTWPALWLAAADSTVQPQSPLPFLVALQALSCNPDSGPRRPCGGPINPPDDYAFVFTPASGEPSLTLATGQTGALAVTTAPGLQHLTVQNLRSYQTENCDDYWNWGWWAVGHADASGNLD